MTVKMEGLILVCQGAEEVRKLLERNTEWRVLAAELARVLHVEGVG